MGRKGSSAASGCKKLRRRRLQAAHGACTWVAGRRARKPERLAALHRKIQKPAAAGGGRRRAARGSGVGALRGAPRGPGAVCRRAPPRPPFVGRRRPPRAASWPRGGIQGRRAGRGALQRGVAPPRRARRRRGRRAAGGGKARGVSFLREGGAGIRAYVGRGALGAGPGTDGRGAAPREGSRQQRRLGERGRASNQGGLCERARRAARRGGCAGAGPAGARACRTSAQRGGCCPGRRGREARAARGNGIICAGGSVWGRAGARPSGGFQPPAVAAAGGCRGSAPAPLESRKGPPRDKRRAGSNTRAPLQRREARRAQHGAVHTSKHA
ncbi:MAG: hypothetical protein J3K34DRAFT_81868 [Monoraphidium minutum]|nr:MAG: hypothetical protein J3K34DRAFT_81868 [Monoraphidium minutum]